MPTACSDARVSEAFQAFESNLAIKFFKHSLCELFNRGEVSQQLTMENNKLRLFLKGVRHNWNELSERRLFGRQALMLLYVQPLQRCRHAVLKLLVGLFLAFRNRVRRDIKWNSMS
jgi:hypothetical protein